MGNMAACLDQQRTTTAVPAVSSPKQGRLISLKLLMKAIRRMKTKRAGGGSGRAKIDGKSLSSSSSLSSTTAAAEDGSKGGGWVEEKSKVAVSNNPKGAVLRSRLHGRGGDLRKGAVRVKVVLTKEEAARLLSLTVGGHKTAAAQIVAEIKRMEARRVANTAAAAAAWRPALASIPEEAS